MTGLSKFTRLAAAWLLLIGSSAMAQDMPLTQVLLPGEG